MSDDSASGNAAEPAAARQRINYVDGLRAIAAIYVVLHHALLTVLHDSHAPALPDSVIRSTKWLMFGHTAVAVFIVLSGFCLMLPNVNSGLDYIRGGFRDYFKRRARRILPPYYAALVFTLALVVPFPVLQHPSGTNWDTALPVFSWGALASHFLLIQDLNPAWFINIDPPMWSVAVEWHIYFLFPLLFFAFRKVGIVGAVFAGMAIGYLIHWVRMGSYDYAQPQFVALFSFGMLACWLAYSTSSGAIRIRKGAPFGALCLLFAAAYIVTFHYIRVAFLHRHTMFYDYQLGLSVCFGLAFCSRTTGFSTGIRRVLEWKPLVAVGGVSYSLYLIHFPLLSVAYLPLTKVPNSLLRLLLLWFVVTPAILALTFAFSRYFEQPFTSTGWKRRAHNK